MVSVQLGAASRCTNHSVVSKALLTLLISLFLLFIRPALAQSSEDVCFGDIELTEYTASVVAGDGNANQNYYSAAEQAEIAAVLADASLSSASAADEVRAVLQACTDGQILQARTSAALN